MVLIGTIKGNGSGVGTFIYLDQCFIRITMPILNIIIFAMIMIIIPIMS